MENNILQRILYKLVDTDIKNNLDLDKFKRKISADFCIPMITNAQLLEEYNNLVKLNMIKTEKRLFELLKKRKIRTLSGVAPVAVLTKPFECPGECVFCPTEKNMPKSYLSNEPAVMRAILTEFDPFKQVQTRIKALKKNGHCTDKIELIVMGGTWSYFPQDYKEEFIKRCFDACNGFDANTLEQAQIYNQTAQNRIIGLTLETRPDYIDEQEILHMRQLGCTRVEIGVQAIDDYILQLNKRKIKSYDIVKATQLLKDAGFKISYHMMPNLPGSNIEKDLAIFKQLFNSPDYQPDMLKIYPCVVTQGSELFDWYKNGKYKPYTDEELLNLLFNIKQIIPEYVRITRLIRDIPAESIEAGNKISNLREIVQRKLKDNNIYCKCIRCREARNKTVNAKEAKLFIDKYQASQGKEYFLQYCSPDRKTLYAFLRLRIPNKNNIFINDLDGCAIIRELHTYGKMVPINQQNKNSVQHVGFGKKLIQQAEKICSKNNISKLAVISGIGVKEYYQKLGFEPAGTYLRKKLI